MGVRCTVRNVVVAARLRHAHRSPDEMAHLLQRSGLRARVRGLSAVVRSESGECAVLRAGGAVWCTGTASTSAAAAWLRRVTSPLGGLSTPPRVASTTAVCELGTRLDSGELLELLAAALPGRTGVRMQSPPFMLTWWPPGVKGSMLIYPSGRVIAVGAWCLEDVENAAALVAGRMSALRRGRRGTG